MKKKFAVRKIFLNFALVACIGVGATGIAYGIGVAENTPDHTFTISSEIKDSYLVGESFDVPSGAFGETAAEATVTYPDGSVRKTQRLIFSAVGEYTLNYAAHLDGKNFVERKTFVVRNVKYAVDKQTASVVYESARSFGYYNAPDYADQTVEKAGLMVTLTEGATFSYNKVFDLSGMTKDDVVFRANIVASETGTADFWSFTVRFTDAYDAENYVDVVLWHNGNKDPQQDKKNDGTNYIRAGASNQTPTGYEVGKDNVHVGKYGNYAYVSMMNMPSTKNGDISVDTLNVSFDYDERIVYGPEYRMIGKNMVVDLDDPKFFTEFWNGFTTGECTVSCFASDFKKNSGAVFIQSIFDDEGEDFAENLLTENTPPTIAVDFNGYEDTLPFAVVGERYPVFSATANDLSGVAPDLSVKVYYNYSSESPISVGVKNGAFIPEKTGVYTIVYTATDCFGLQAEKTVKINCVSAEQKLQVKIGEIPAESGLTGTYIPVAPISSKLHSGVPMYEITATFNGTEYPIDTNGLQFRPLQAGEYKVEYKATDYLGRASVDSYTVEVADGEKPVYFEDVLLPKYFVGGYEQTLPKLSAFDYRDGGKEIESEIFVVEDGKTERKLENGVFVPTIKDEPYTVTVIYRATGKDGVGEKRYEVPCYSVYQDGSTSKIDKAKLFVPDEGVEISYQTLTADDSTEYASYKTAKDAGITYLNAVPAHGFSLEFNIFNDYNAFEKLNVILTDAENEDVAVKMTYWKKDDSSIYVSVNDGTKFEVNGYSFSMQETRITCSYDNQKKTAYTDYGKSAFAVANGLNGNVFNGFESGKIYVRIEWENVSGESQIAVRKIWNQQLVSSTRDNTSAILVIDGVYAKRFSIGQQFIVHKAVYMDMIDPESIANVSFYTPSGEVVYDTDGKPIENGEIEREYTTVLTEYGNYRLVYELDSGEAYEYYFTVVDEVPPVITVKTEPKATYKTGATLKLSATAKDGISGNCEIFVCVENSYGETDYVTANSYTFRKAGNYTITYFAYDEFGNYGYKTYEVTVEDK